MPHFFRWDLDTVLFLLFVGYLIVGFLLYTVTYILLTKFKVRNADELAVGAGFAGPFAIVLGYFIGMAINGLIKMIQVFLL